MKNIIQAKGSRHHRSVCAHSLMKWRWVPSRLSVRGHEARQEGCDGRFNRRQKASRRLSAGLVSVGSRTFCTPFSPRWRSILPQQEIPLGSFSRTGFFDVTNAKDFVHGPARSV